ncbi:unnamed protein product, partial [Rotaria magnacalcarata]
MNIEDIQKIPNLFPFWEHYQQKFPCLSLLARHLFSIPVTSAALERFFSAVGLAVTERRSTLDRQTLNDILFVISIQKIFEQKQTFFLSEELEFDSSPIIIHTTAHHLSNRLSTNADQSYIKGNRLQYFFASPSDSIIFDDDNTNETKFQQTEPDAILSSLSSYWYTYITKHAHLSLS